MKRKDGKPKRRALRTKPVFEHGFAANPRTASYRHPCWTGGRQAGHQTAVSLFCGCGGLDLGFTGGFNFMGHTYESQPVSVVHAVDNSPDAIVAYRLNLGDHAVIDDLSVAQISDIPPAEILLGGFPCQDFSSSGTKTGFDGTRGQLYQVMVDYMARHQPKIVVAENVPHLARLRKGRYLKVILQEMEDQGYHFDVWDLDAPAFGIPQSRRRIFLVGVRDDLPGYPVCPTATHADRPVFIDAALADLEEVTDESVTNQSQYFVASRASAGGGQGDHTNQAGSVAYCIRANARGRIQFHYKLPRRLTVRECARLQSFPDEFVFPFSTQRNMTLVGNAVPPVLAYHVGVSVQRFLDGEVRADTTVKGKRVTAGLRPSSRQQEASSTQIAMFT
jgi:DNA (cytosine-5)-methyltransferase 1